MTPVILIILLALIAGYMIYQKVPLAKKDELGKTINIVGVMTTAFSLAWAAYTYDDSARRQRELAAHTTYQDHLKLSMQNPDLAKASIAPMPPKEDQSDKPMDQKIKNYDRYQWYVGHAFLSFESILEVMSDDPDWKQTFRDFIAEHERYVKSKDFPCKNYSTKIEQLVREVTGRIC